MIKRLLRFLLGYYALSIPAKYASLTINLLRENNAVSWGYSLAGDNLRLFVMKNGYKCLKEKIGTTALLLVEKRGAPFFLYRYRNHVGLLCGGAVALFLLLSSFSVLWDVRIEGNEIQSDRQIAETLKGAGLDVGERIHDLDTKKIANCALLSDPHLSFVGVNLRGCVAYVTVRETQGEAVEETPKASADLVASCDGLIESLSVECGEILVRAGQVVKAGDVLVSGVRKGLNGDVPVHAKGDVYARVNRTFSVTVPSIIEKKATQKKKICDFSLLFWGKSVNIYRNTGNLPSEYDTIYEKDFFCIQDGVRLPFGYHCTGAVLYKKESQTLTETEQIALALSRLEEELVRALQGGELLKKRVRGDFVDGMYTVTCEIECIVNIATVRESTME